MKRTFQAFCSFIIVRYLVKGILYLLKITDRVISNFKYRALVTDCSNSICHWSTQIKYPENISVGSDTRIGPNCTLGAKGSITIGANVVISKQVVIESAGLDLKAGPPYNSHLSNAIEIEDNVWIGTQAIILGGVRIGKNAIIGAGTVIVKDVPAGSIVVGSPNRFINKK
jgi:maltose O-acetyltransferase